MKNKYDWVEIQLEYDSGVSQRQLANKYKMSDRSFRLARDRGDFTPRSKSEAITNYYKTTEVTLSEEHKKKISDSMKIAHSEGRAWNIGMSRWNNEPSYPEQFFMRVIENEFSDKNFIREFPFNRFSLDFAWVHKKVCIEIDGEQHYRFPEYAERDAIKDSMLMAEGWKVLRLRWSDLINNTKEKIKEAKNLLSN